MDDVEDVVVGLEGEEYGVESGVLRGEEETEGGVMSDARSTVRVWAARSGAEVSRTSFHPCAVF